MRRRHGWTRAPARLAVVAAAAVGLFSPDSVAAQQVTGALSLDEALSLAAIHNPVYRQALNTMELSVAERKAAWGAFLPTLSLTVGTSLTANRQTTAFDNFGNPIQNPVTEYRTTSNASQSLSASLTLFEGGKRFHEMGRVGAQATARARAAEADLVAVEAEVRRQYFATLNQLALIEIETEILEGRRVDLEQSRALFRLADAAVSRVDLQTAELEILKQERVIARARSDYRKAVLQLVTEVGDPTLGNVLITGEAPDPFDPGALDVEELVRRANAGNATLLQGEADLRVDEFGLRDAKGTRWPTVSLNFTAQQSASAAEREALFDGFPDESRVGRASLNFSLPIFSGFQTSSQVAQADVALRNAEEQLRKTRLDVGRDVRGRFIDLQAAFEDWLIAGREVDLADDRIRLGREEYRLAGRTFTELQTDVKAAAEARRSLLNARYDFLSALIDLEATAGIEILNTTPGA